MNDSTAIQTVVGKFAEDCHGILPLEPAWVARTFLPPGRRLGLKEKEYSLGKRGGICERWLASITPADNPVKVPDEGLSFLALGKGKRITLRDAVKELPDVIMGTEYAATHPRGLDRLAKLFDYKYRIPFHLHQMKQHAALVGRNPKEEAYYFPAGVELGPEPETYFGLHPSIVEKNDREILLPYLRDWDSDLILRHSRAFKIVPDDGWHVPSGILHAPGSALTIELQEDSDVFAMLQAKAGGKIISKELLFKDVTPEDRERHAERIILEMIDWKANGDHYFYESHHTPPILIHRSSAAEEYWIFYNTMKFSGKRLVVKPGQTCSTKDAGVYSLFVWKGKGSFEGQPIEAENDMRDELLVCHHAATKGIEVKNTGKEDLEIFKFFGPDVNPDVPMLKPYAAGN